MRKYGEIAEVSFRRQGFSIHNLADEFTLRYCDQVKKVYVNSMLELKSEITKFKGEF